MKSPSIRRTLLLRTGVGVSLLLCLLAAATYWFVRHGLYAEMDASLEQTAALLANEVELEDGKIIFEWQEGLGTNKLPTDEGLFQYWNENSGVTTRSPALGGEDLPKFHGPRGTPELRDIRLPKGERSARALGLVVYPFVLPEEHERMIAENRVIDPKSLPHVLVVARDVEPLHRILARLRWLLLGGTLATLGLGYLLIVLAVRSSLVPIDHLAELIRKRSARNFDQGLEMPGRLPAELIGLAEDFDALLLRVASTRNRERDFIRNAAHELRTPIAGLQATTELALSRPRDIEACIVHLKSCHKTATELGLLVGRLSALARLGNSAEPPVMQAVDVVDIVKDALRNFQAVLQERGVMLEWQIADGAPKAHSDPATLRLILNNLLDNALSYGAFPGTLRIGLLQRDGALELALANPISAAPEDPERWFEPFFRRSAARDDAGAHLGIGLTLSREAAQTIGGNLTARVPATGGIELVLRLPLAV